MIQGGSTHIMYTHLTVDDGAKFLEENGGAALVHSGDGGVRGVRWIVYVYMAIQALPPI